MARASLTEAKLAEWDSTTNVSKAVPYSMARFETDGAENPLTVVSEANDAGAAQAGHGSCGCFTT